MGIEVSLGLSAVIAWLRVVVWSWMRRATVEPDSLTAWSPAWSVLPGCNHCQTDLVLVAVLDDVDGHLHGFRIDLRGHIFMGQERPGDLKCAEDVLFGIGLSTWSHGFCDRVWNL